MNARTGSEALLAALDYAGRGWRVLPIWRATEGRCDCGKPNCERPGKHPITREGVKEATTDQDRIRAWYTAHPDANVGIATGSASGLLVVDADAANGKPGVVNLTRLCAEHGGLPPTMRVNTSGGGFHLYFKFSDALRTGSNVLAEAVDVRADEGYVIAPPSVHRSGTVYAFADEAAHVLELPTWLRPQSRRRGVARTRREEPVWDLEELESALEKIDPDDRDCWLKVGVILGRTFNRSAEAWAMYEEWSARSEKFQEHRAENIERMRDMFYTRSQEAPRAGRDELTIGTLIKLARDGGWTGTPLRDSDHYRLAQAVISSIEGETGERPVSALGALWCVEEGIWRPRKLDEVAMDVAKRFSGGKYCKRGADYSSIANVVAKSCDSERFFEGAAVGIASPGGFWRVTEAGEIECEPLTPAHRQRMRVAADPDVEAEPRLLLKVLRDAFGEGDDADEQIRLVQQLFGCAITRSLWRHRHVALFLGATNSGKSTLLTLLSSVFPDEQVGACSPQRWGDEYYVAALAGIALNIVGDLDKKDPIPGYFKNVVGRDLIQGRHPTHRPFAFVCEASHFFNSNFCPPTADHSDAFFNRWRIVYFTRSVPMSQRDRNLDERLKAEETGAMLGWALRGAAEVNRAGALIETKTHAAALRKWRVANNSALAFLCDDQECELRESASTPGQDLFNAYRKWATDNGMRAFGRNGFYDALIEGAGQVGIGVVPRETSADHQMHVSGVRLKHDPRDPRF